MNELKKKVLESFEQEQLGDYLRGIDILKKAKDDLPENQTELLYELSMMYFRNGRYDLALEGFIEYFDMTKSQDILDFISEAYIEPNCDEYRENYEKNKELLKDYPFFYADTLSEFDLLEELPVWKDEERVVYFAGGSFIEKEIRVLNKSKLIPGCVAILVNEFDLDEIQEINKITQKEFLDGSKLPLYLYYDTSCFNALLQTEGIERLFQRDRTVFLVGEEKLKEFFRDLQAILPTGVFNHGPENVTNVINGVIKEKMVLTEKFETLLTADYYSKTEETILRRVASGNPKILFITSRFTTALQYHCKNMKEAAEKLGLETETIIEKSDLHRVLPIEILLRVQQIQPDIIFLMDHFRFEFYGKISSPVFVTWIQDALPNITDAQTPEKLNDKDIILNHFITWDKILDAGFDSTRMIDAPIPANSNIYKSYEMTENEKKSYSSDICFVCHGADVENCISAFTAGCQDGILKSSIVNMFLSYYEMVMKTERIFYFQQEFKEFIMHYFFERFHIDLETEELEQISFYMCYTYNQRVYRQLMVNWLIEAGYTNLKLWGNGWLEDKKYAPYAMGPAQNGEQLSKIYQCSKIVLGNNINGTAAARVWECMLSGGFYMANYVPPAADVVDIRKILDPADFVMFQGKEDMIQKIDYYLNHEKERQQMIQTGREKAREKMTFDVLFEGVLSRLKDIFSSERK